eukprot:Skav205151  [mRNA]  locus=scaffold593:283348:284906:- [translate_table: standard]
MLPCQDRLKTVLRADKPRPFHSSSVACKYWATAQHCRRSMGIPCLGIAATGLWTLCVTYCLVMSLPAHSWWAGATPCNALPECVDKVTSAYPQIYHAFVAVGLGVVFLREGTLLMVSVGDQLLASKPKATDLSHRLEFKDYLSQYLLCDFG